MSNPSNNVVPLRGDSAPALEGDIITADAVRLGELETVIEDRYTTVSRGFIEIGVALAVIRDERLFAANGHADFTAYLNTRWSNVGYTRASQLIGAAETAREVAKHTSVVIPNEGVARTLTPILKQSDAETAARVLEAVAASGSKVTMKSITAEAAARGVTPTKRKSKPADQAATALINKIDTQAQALIAAVEAFDAAHGDYNFDKTQRDNVTAAKSQLDGLKKALDAAAKRKPKKRVVVEPTVEPTPEPAVEAAEPTVEPTEESWWLDTIDIEAQIIAKRAAQATEPADAEPPVGLLRNGDHPAFVKGTPAEEGKSYLPGPKVLVGGTAFGSLGRDSGDTHYMCSTVKEAKKQVADLAAGQADGAGKPDGDGWYTRDDWKLFAGLYAYARVWTAFADADAAARYEAWITSLVGTKITGMDTYELAAQLVDGVPAGVGVMITDTPEGHALGEVLDPQWVVALITAEQAIHG